MKRRDRAATGGGIDPVQEGPIERHARDPAIAIAVERHRLAIDQQQAGGLRCRIKSQGPFQPRTERRLRIKPGGVALGKRGIGRWQDAEILGNQSRKAGRGGDAFLAGRKGRRTFAGARPQHHGDDDEDGCARQCNQPPP